MSEPIPESVPSSFDSTNTSKRQKISKSGSHRENEKGKRSNVRSATDLQAKALANLLNNPDRASLNVPLASLSTSAVAAANDPFLKKKAVLPPPPEIVANVQGSSAGAGSGEFHVYKASRRREYERVKMMEEEALDEAADQAFHAQREARQQKEREMEEKRRKKRRGKGKAKLSGKDDSPIAPITPSKSPGHSQGIEAMSTLDGKDPDSVIMPQNANFSEREQAASSIPTRLAPSDAASDLVEGSGLVIHDEDD